MRKLQKIETVEKTNDQRRFWSKGVITLVGKRDVVCKGLNFNLMGISSLILVFEVYVMVPDQLPFLECLRILKAVAAGQ